MRPLFVASLSRTHWAWLAPLVPTDGAVYGIVFVLLCLLFLRRSARVEISPDDALGALVAGAAGAVIGTRLFFLVTTGALFDASPLTWPDLRRGTASWGVYLGGLTGLALYGRLAAAPLVPILDVAASCGGLGDLLGRWACLLAGDDFGRLSSLPWAIRFPAGSPAHHVHAARGLIDPAAASSLPVHPFQLYLVMNGGLVFLVTTLAWRRWRGRPGVTLAVFLGLYGGSRFWWEFLRDPAAGGARGLFSVSQWTCLALLLLACAVWLTVRPAIQSARCNPCLRTPPP